MKKILLFCVLFTISIYSCKANIAKEKSNSLKTSRAQLIIPTQNPGAERITETFLIVIEDGLSGVYNDQGSRLPYQDYIIPEIVISDNENMRLLKLNISPDPITGNNELKGALFEEIKIEYDRGGQYQLE